MNRPLSAGLCRIAGELTEAGRRYLFARAYRVLTQRIACRGIDYEQAIEGAYSERLGGAYSRFFADYEDAPLLVVDTQYVNLLKVMKRSNVSRKLRPTSFERRFLGPTTQVVVGLSSARDGNEFARENLVSVERSSINS